MSEIDKLKNVLLWYKAAGIKEFFIVKPTHKPSRRKTIKSKKAILLEELRREIGNCRRCKLYKNRTNLVFGEGNPEAKIMFVGEAPGEEEDKQGRPFVGLAGQLLTRLIESIGLKRSDVYIANVLKCRPPGNRNPQEDEIAACSPFLFKQIEIIKPKVICALGSFAAKVLLDQNLPISKIRGKVLKDKRGYLILPTYHPAYLLRNPRQKRTAIEDFKKLKELIEES